MFERKDNQSKTQDLVDKSRNSKTEKLFWYVGCIVCGLLTLGLIVPYLILRFHEKFQESPQQNGVTSNRENSYRSLTAVQIGNNDRAQDAATQKIPAYHTDIEERARAITLGSRTRVN